MVVVSWSSIQWKQGIVMPSVGAQTWCDRPFLIPFFFLPLVHLPSNPEIPDVSHWPCPLTSTAYTNSTIPQAIQTECISWRLEGMFIYMGVKVHEMANWMHNSLRSLAVTTIPYNHTLIISLSNCLKSMFTQGFRVDSTNGILMKPRSRYLNHQTARESESTLASSKTPECAADFIPAHSTINHL